MKICEIYIKWAAHDELCHSNGDGVEGLWGYQLEEKKKESSLTSHTMHELSIIEISNIPLWNAAINIKLPWHCSLNSNATINDDLLEVTYCKYSALRSFCLALYWPVYSPVKVVWSCLDVPQCSNIIAQLESSSKSVSPRFKIRIALQKYPRSFGHRLHKYF